MSLVARPSFLWERATAREVIWPWVSVDSSSLCHMVPPCAHNTRQPLAHFGKDVAHNLAIVILSDVQELRPAQDVVKVVLRDASVCVCTST